MGRAGGLAAALRDGGGRRHGNLLVRWWRGE
jgi:hypothetical protein